MKKAFMASCAFLLLVGAGLPAFAQFTAATIAGIQNGVYSEGAQLEVTGVVSAVDPAPVPSYVYAQEAAAVRSGIRCYGGGGTVTGINVGDEVTVQAVYDEPFGETQLNFSATGSIVINSVGNTPYAALALSGANFPYDATSDTNPAEDYEGVLVRVANVTITDTTSPGYGMVDGTDDGGAHTLRFDSDNPALAGALELGKIYNITGVARYDYGDYKVFPRDATDIVDLSGVESWTSY